MGSERFASPIMGIFCGGLNAYCMRIWPLFLRTSGSSGVLKALLLERNRQLSCNPKKNKKKKKQAATDALRARVLLHEYGDQSTYYFHHLHRQRKQATIMSSLQQQPNSPLADLCTEAGRRQADSIIVSFFSADSPTGMFQQLPIDVTAQQALLSSFFFFFFFFFFWEGKIFITQVQ